MDFAPWAASAATGDGHHRQIPGIERPMTLAPVISGRGLEKSYGQVQAVRGIDLELAPATCLGLLKNTFE